MDDFLRDQNRTRRQDHKYHCLVRNPICFEDDLRWMLADSRRARLLGRRAPLRKRNAAAKELAGRSTAAPSFGQSAKGVAVLLHELQAELHLFFDIWIIGRQ